MKRKASANKKVLVEQERNAITNTYFTSFVSISHTKPYDNTSFLYSIRPVRTYQKGQYKVVEQLNCC